MTEIEKKKLLGYWAQYLTIQSLGYPNVKIQVLSPFPFQEKLYLLFAPFGLFLAGNRAGSQIQGSESKFFLKKVHPFFMFLVCRFKQFYTVKTGYNVKKKALIHIILSTSVLKFQSSTV